MRLRSIRSSFEKRGAFSNQWYDGTEEQACYDEKNVGFSLRKFGISRNISKVNYINYNGKENILQLMLISHSSINLAS